LKFSFRNKKFFEPNTMDDFLPSRHELSGDRTPTLLPQSIVSHPA
jgi:hypothetical protein